MKHLLLLFLCFQLIPAFSQLSNEEINEHFINIWGVLKYHHPTVSNGEVDINQEFIKEHQKLQSITTKEAFDREMLEWIESFGIEDFQSEQEATTESLFTKNHNVDWINNSNFSPPLLDLLNKLVTNTNYEDHYAKVNKLSSSVDFSKDAPLADFNVSKEEYRLLFLASFWNAMKYWNVNLYLTETPWGEVLREMLPNFALAGKENFERAKEQLFSQLNDSHSNYGYSTTLNAIDKFPSFGGRIINDSLVITSIYKSKIFEADSLSKGDVIHAIEGLKLPEYYNKRFSKVISASNENYLKSAIEKSYLLASTRDSVLVSVLKTDGQNLNQYFQLSPLKYYYERFERLHSQKTQNTKELSAEIGYLNLYEIDKKQLKQAFNDFADYKGLVIDLRNYPKYIGAADIAKYLYPERTQFIKALTPLKPAYGSYDSSTALSFISSPFVAGKRNKSYYKGQVILLVDKTTASKAEWIGMAIQAAPNCITIGEQTFGAVMNRNEIPLLDGTTIDFTAVGAFYPDDTSVQRKGLKLDYEIKENALQYDKDLYVKKAIELLSE